MMRIGKGELARRLEKAIDAPVGMEGLNILIYGWRLYRKYGPRYADALKHRAWLYITEVQDLSEYAGYDLNKSESIHLYGQE